LKGKTTRGKPVPVVSDYIEIPSQLFDLHQDVTLCMDGMTINCIPFLTAVSRSIMYRTAEWIESKTPRKRTGVYWTMFSEFIIVLGIPCITTIHCDNEFRPLMDELQDVYHVI
jgi:hypothetical protein